MSDPLAAIHDVTRMTRLSKSRVYALMKAGDFPLPREIEGRSLWKESVVQAWIDRRYAEAPVVGSVAGREAAAEKKAA